MDLDLKFYLNSNNQTHKGIYYISETGGYFLKYHAKKRNVKFHFHFYVFKNNSLHFILNVSYQPSSHFSLWQENFDMRSFLEDCFLYN